MLSLFFLSIFLFLLLLKFTVKIEVFYEFQLETKIYFGLGNTFLQIPPFLLRKLEQRVRNRPAKSFSHLFERIRLLIRLLERFVQEINAFRLEIIFGVGDPFWTALGCAGFWSFGGPLITGLQNRVKKPPVIKIEPCFENDCLRARLYCIFQFRLGQIILSELTGLANTFTVGT